MLISKKWLQEFITLPSNVSDKELAKRLSLSTVEVEGYASQAEAWDHIVVGRIMSIVAHPNADKLRICNVDIGEKKAVKIVCGGKNVAEGMLVVVALPGSKVRWHGEGDLITLQETTIRGEASFGMICASAEVGLDRASNEGDHDIRDLGDISAKPGTSLAKAMHADDVVFEVDNKSLTNRPDLVGHFGMARELAALYRLKLVEKKPAKLKSGPANGRAGKGYKLAVKVESAAACPRYTAVVVEGVKVGPSPAWMQGRLAAVGIRPINNVVDVTNYVMMEGGQSLHAFDAAKLSKEKNVQVNVRFAKKGETLVTLDGVERKLDPSMLLITTDAPSTSSGNKALVIAGIMGGKESGIADGTTTILLESANFDPSVIRKTSQALGLRSEASMRYEKSLDPMLCDTLLARAVELLKDLHPNANVVSSIVDVSKKLPKPLKLQIDSDWLESRLGITIKSKEVSDILSRLGFGVKSKRSSWTLTVPSWRATKDIAIPEDIVEEVARIYGYERIPSSMPLFPCKPPVQDPLRIMARQMRGTLTQKLAATETYQYAYARPQTLETLGFKLSDHLKLANPLSDERPYLVRSLVPNLLENVAKNQHQESSLRIFEVARVFHGEAKGEENGAKGFLPAQPYRLAIAVSNQGDEKPFVSMRQIVMSLLSDLGYAADFKTYDGESWSHAGRSAHVVVAGKTVGYVCEASPNAAMTMGIDRRVAVAEIELENLLAITPSPISYTPPSVFPEVKRDLALVVADRTEYDTIESALKKSSPLLKSIELFDVYRGKGVEEGKKSIALHLVFRADDKTLEAATVDAELGKLTGVLTSQFEAMMRS